MFFNWIFGILLTWLIILLLWFEQLILFWFNFTMVFSYSWLLLSSPLISTLVSILLSGLFELRYIFTSIPFFVPLCSESMESPWSVVWNVSFRVCLKVVLLELKTY